MSSSTDCYSLLVTTTQERVGDLKQVAGFVTKSEGRGRHFLIQYPHLYTCRYHFFLNDFLTAISVLGQALTPIFSVPQSNYYAKKDYLKDIITAVTVIFESMVEK